VFSLLTALASIASVSNVGTMAATSIKAAAGRVLGYYLHNRSAAGRFVKIFYVLVGSVTMGTTAPIYEIPIPAGGRAQIDIPAGLGDTAAIVYDVTSEPGLTNNVSTGLAVNAIVGWVAFA